MAGNIEAVRPTIKSPFDRNLVTHLEGFGKFLLKGTVDIASSESADDIFKVACQIHDCALKWDFDVFLLWTLINFDCFTSKVICKLCISATKTIAEIVRIMHFPS